MNTSLDALNDIDALIICTEWKEFWSIDINMFLKKMRNPVIFDGRNIYSPQKMKDCDIVYYGIGRRS